MLYLFEFHDVLEAYKLKPYKSTDSIAYVNIGNTQYGIVVKEENLKYSSRCENVQHLKYKDRVIFVDGRWEPI